MRRPGIVTAALAVLALALAGPGAEGAEKVKLLFVRGGGIHDWKGLSPILVDVLGKTGDFEVTLTENLDDLRAESIQDYDVVLFYCTGLNFTDPAQEQGLCDFVRDGGGYAGIHSATDSFKRSEAYWELVGGRFAGHGGGKYTVHIYDREHPITEGLEDFEIHDETYRHAYHKNACIRCLVRMDRGKERQCMGWVQRYGQGRVFYTGLGHGKSAWTNRGFQRLVVRGLYWAAGREPKDP
ncbi:MAG: ThuA domain-containing protein [bacterium]